MRDGNSKESKVFFCSYPSYFLTGIVNDEVFSLKISVIFFMFDVVLIVDSLFGKEAFMVKETG